MGAMKFFLARALFAATWLVAADVALAQRLPSNFAADPSQVHVRLVTFGPGTEVHQYFAHDALWVHDARTGISALFNYGMFSFGPDMLPKYMKGILTFWVEATPVKLTFQRYKEMNRSILVQELNLTNAQKARLVRRLVHDIQPENRFYRYHHYTDNCTTRLRDDLDEALGGEFKKAFNVSGRLNYREHTWRYSQQDPIVHMALIFWMNDFMERPITRWDEAFLPLELVDLVAEFKTKDEHGNLVPLVSSTYDIYKSDHPGVPKNPAPKVERYLALGVSLGVLALAMGLLYGFARSSKLKTLGRVLFGLCHAAFGASFGLLGILGSAMWAFTEHTVTYHNENQLQANALTFLLLPMGLMFAFGHRGALRWTARLMMLLSLLSVLGLLAKVLPVFDQYNALVMAMTVPINVGLGAVHWLMFVRDRRSQQMSAKQQQAA